MTTNNFIRLFWAIDIPEELKAKLFFSEIKKINNLKIVKRENLHLTLCFLGEIPETIFNSYSEKIKTLDTNDVNAFTIELKNTGVFPDLKRPSVFWIGVIDKELLINKLYKKIYDFSLKELKEYFIEKKSQKFQPHITIGRIKGKTNSNTIKEIIKKYTDYSFGKFEVDKIKLYQSTLKPTGSEYIKIFEINLNKRSDKDE
ncbi:MAG TPA: RNA 2',3'-cyclic phosphodiesterase [bacterium]|nr:RNA 2',3'-cyclic phosphodiesterase [bacterium]HOL48075.1 RNA 2',3'-cyclic phosphodiesterase [bacterium]HPQ19096.1 RNA 2',3'-cyclic phosphodiesterase [bacterium]